MWIELEWEAQWNTICQVEMNERQVDGVLQEERSKEQVPGGLIERVVANQLTEYLSANDLLPRFQSAFRTFDRNQSTETALLRVWSDMLMAADERKVTLLSLHDMSASFDCVNHLIMLRRLQVRVGIGNTALDWIRSFLSGRTQQVVYSDEQSVTSAMLFGVPQGTILGPLLYIPYATQLFDIIAQHRVNAHEYADDLQLYICVPPVEATIAADYLDACLVDVEAWLKASRLRLNSSKTQVMLLGSAQQ